MATSAAVSVGTSAVAVATGSGTRHDVTVRNNGPNTVYLGGSNVASTNGYNLINGGDVTYSLGEAETLYGICAATASPGLLPPCTGGAGRASSFCAAG